MPSATYKKRPAAPLLRWYDRVKRDLPWRPTPTRPANPYHVLVSEAMLQQTQVATVIDYFNRFITELPTVEALAQANEQRVLRLWQGLGYYRRARHLHAAGKMIVQDFDGCVPDTVEQLLKLPGVGRYCAGAIASIAYDRPAPILDGNVARVLARVEALQTSIDETATKKQLWLLAEQIVPRRRAGDFNQAMMELGATVCLPRNAKCQACPLAKMCDANAQQLVDALPIRSEKRKPKTVTHTVIAVDRNGRFLFEQRGSGGLWAGLWQMPTSEEVIEPAAWVRQNFGLDIAKPKTITTFTHQTTHRTIRFNILRAAVKRGRLRPGRGQWRTLSNLDDLPLANPQRAAIEALQTI